MTTLALPRFNILTFPRGDAQRTLDRVSRMFSQGAMGQGVFAQPLGGAGTVAAGPLLYDTFTDTNGTLLTAHTMDVGSGWSGSGFDIQDNQANATTASGSVGGTAGIWADAGASDGTLTCIITPAGNITMLLARLSDGSNTYIIGLFNQNLYIFKFEAASISTLGSTPFSYNTGTPYTIQVVLSGTSIIATVDGVSEVNVSDAFNQTATKYGLNIESGGAVGTLFDDFQFV